MDGGRSRVGEKKGGIIGHPRSCGRETKGGILGRSGLGETKEGIVGHSGGLGRAKGGIVRRGALRVGGDKGRLRGSGSPGC